MDEAVEVVHVAWGVSRAESVRDALRLLGRMERVIALSGTLNVGPIGPPDPASRLAWATANLCDEVPCSDWHEAEAPWTEALSHDVHPVYWVCLSDAAEHASFLAFASRMVDRPLDIIDATGLDVPTMGGVSRIWSLGVLRPQDIIACGLYAKRREVSRAEREGAAAAWSLLQRENAPLRVMRDGHLVSAPLTHFDSVLVQWATPDWESVVKLIGCALDYLTVAVDPPGQGPGYELLFARVLALGEAGTLDVTGPGPGMRDYKVRRPAAPPSR